MFLLCIPCGGTSSNYQYHSAEKQDFNRDVNPKSMPDNPDLSYDITLLNRDYPTIYRDNAWYHDLPNLDSGKGTWKHKSGKLVLQAKRDLSNMEIDILAIEENADDVVLEFIDRHGQEILEVEKMNFK